MSINCTALMCYSYFLCHPLSVSVCHWLTRSYPHTRRASYVLCLALRVLQPDTKSLISDISHKSLLINSSPGTKLAFGPGRCSYTSLTAAVGQKNADGCSFPVHSFPSLFSSSLFFSHLCSYIPSPSHGYFYPACSAMLAGVSAIS